MSGRHSVRFCSRIYACKCAHTHTHTHTCQDLEWVRIVVVSSSEVANSFSETCMIIQEMDKIMDTLRN
jgi:hypothetical protein